MASAEQWASSSSPPTNAEEYAKKPLPPIPCSVRSTASSFTSEVSQVFTSPKSATQDGPFMFDWEVESSDRSVRLHQSIGPDDMIQMRLRSRKYSFSAFVPEDPPTVSRKSSAVSSRPVPGSAGLERRIAQATAGPDPRPPLAHRHTLPITLDTFSTPTVPPDEILSPRPRLSVQKILKLTGNLSRTTAISTDTPSLHNSPQKIRQLTGLDCGPRRGSEIQLQTLDEEDSSSSSELSFRTYNHEIPQDTVYVDPPESTYAQSYEESMDELITPLAAAPRYRTPVPPPTQDTLLRDDNSHDAMKEAWQLSGFVPADVGVTTPEEKTPLTGRPDSWYGDSEEEFHSSSSSEISESEFEMEPTAAELYHDSAVAIAKSSPMWSPSGSGLDSDALSPIPRHLGWDSKHQTNDSTQITRSRGSTQGSIGSTIDSTLSHMPLAPRPSAFNRFRKKNNLSERRGHAPSPLETITSSSTWGTQPRRTPYPPVSSSIRATVEESGDSHARFSLLSRIFTNGSSSSVSIEKRDSMASSESGRTPSLMSAKLADRMTPVTSAWSPETPSPGTVTFGDTTRNSSGLLARTMSHARHAAGRKSKADKAEARRGSLRGKIKVLRDADDATIDLDRRTSPGL